MFLLIDHPMDYPIVSLQAWRRVSIDIALLAHIRTNSRILLSLSRREDGVFQSEEL